MKKTILAFALLLMSISASAFDLRDLFGGGGDGQQGSGSALGDVLGGILGDLTSTDEFQPEQLVGTWVYAAPAINLDGGNALAALGGSAASSVVEGKLEPYYQKLGINNLVLTVNEDLTFAMVLKFGTIKGNIEKDEENNLIFNFQAFQKINIGKVKTIAVLSTQGLSLTFDVTKLRNIVSKVAEVAKNQTFQSVSALLNSYDNIYAGFRLTRQKASTTTTTTTTR